VLRQSQVKEEALAMPPFFSILLISCFFLLSVAAGAQALGAEEDLWARAERLHRETPLVDGHNDLPHQLLRRAQGNLDLLDIAESQPELHTDLPRLRESGLGTQIWAAYVHISYYREGTSARRALQMIDLIHRLTERYDLLEMAYTADDIERIHREGRIGSMIGIEGGHAIENDLAALRMYYALGARYMGLTHNISLAWVEAAVDEEEGAGLSLFGEEVVREMNRLGMLVDLAHVSSASMRDAIRVSEAPVIFSHSAARGLTPHNRNVPDDVLQLLRENGGLVMIPFAPSFVNVRPAEASLSDVADHIEYVRQLAGIDHVGIGSDFDGLYRLPEGLEDVTKFKDLTVELLRRGWSDEDIRRLLGQNFLRVLREAEQVAKRLQTERSPSMARLQSPQATNP
jgi:membrane dipeptidase